MTNATRKILNLHEEATHLRLREACKKYCAHVFAKVRIADVLTIDGSGLSDEKYRFALQSHFDFVVSDDKHIPLFAVEFDGPTHETENQKHRDGIKNKICEALSFPLLRINARYIPKIYRNLDLLTWFIEVWFFREAFFNAQEAGMIPQDEPFDPSSVVSLPGREQRFPLWLSVEIRAKIHKLHQMGKCYDIVPSEWTGIDENKNYHGVMWLFVTEEEGVIVNSAIRSQMFPVVERELLSELLVFQLYEELQLALRNEKPLTLGKDIYANVELYKKHYKFGAFSGVVRGK